jgi:hypothetical protein
MVINPTIVIVAYNRTKSLVRILKSLNSAHYIGKANLVISIDYSGNDDVANVANDFNWIFGAKEVITHKKNLGLRKHVLKCGDLVRQYKSIIMLEDDLVVSPYFFHYATTALKNYELNPRVAGISLYTHQFNVNCKKAFEPLLDKSDVYWLQFASSWGQAWNVEQWEGFREWYVHNSGPISSGLPEYILNWPNTSWLKYFTKYLVELDLYFIYPRTSYTTNFSDVGSNVLEKDTTYMVNLNLEEIEPVFSDFENALSVYDSYFEINPSIIKKLNPNLSDFCFDVDLYGIKKLKDIESEYLISRKRSTSTDKKCYSRVHWPQEMNIIFESENESEACLTFAKTNTFKEDSKFLYNDLLYFFKPISLKELSTLLLNKLQKKVCGLLRK